MSKYLNDGLFTSGTDEWETPQDLFDKLDAEFHFTLDVCSTDENAKCRKHYTKEQDGLKQDWTGETVWCNPPYGKGIDAWIRKCREHSYGGGYCGTAFTGQNRHQVVSSVCLSSGRDSFYSWTC